MFNNHDLNTLFRYALALTGEDQSAYDLLQSGLEKLVEKEARGTIELQSRKAYLKKIIRNLYIDLYRRKKIVREEATEDVETLESTGASNAVLTLEFPSLEDTYIKKERVEKLLSQLEDFDREILYLWAVEEYSFAEISQLTGTSKGTLLSRVHRLKLKLKKEETHEFLA